MIDLEMFEFLEHKGLYSLSEFHWLINTASLIFSAQESCGGSAAVARSELRRASAVCKESRVSVG